MRTLNSNKSKQLAYLLRHDRNYDFEIGGWRELTDLCQRYSFTTEDIVDIVSNDSKGRFEFNPDKTKVRALYGHSVKIDLLLRQQEPPLRLYHGTALKYVESIRNNGLISKSRQYVHLTEDKYLAIMTGSRHGQAVLLEINSLAMFNDGYNFYHTNNGTWLTAEVPIQYILF
ncbi:MAG: RNA 2'-phosphotransferase [Muribaculaceae bacterium]|nr:RNA 2'-phosphotransferase [Muribaculaceae bacterium]